MKIILRVTNGNTTDEQRKKIRENVLAQTKGNADVIVLPYGVDVVTVLEEKNEENSD